MMKWKGAHLMVSMGIGSVVHLTCITWGQFFSSPPIQMTIQIRHMFSHIGLA